VLIGAINLKPQNHQNMSNNSQAPIFFFAFANDKQDNARYLRSLTKEAKAIHQILTEAEKQELCQVIIKENAGVEDIFNTFQDERYKNRITAFHYGGHADSYQLLLENNEGKNQKAYTEGLNSFLSKQENLLLVFLNGCCTYEQAQSLISKNIPLVIGTSKEINDEIATKFAMRFYRAFANLENIERSFEEAIDFIKTEIGNSITRGLYRKDLAQIPANEFPWKIYYQDSQRKFLTYKLENPIIKSLKEEISSLLESYIKSNKSDNTLLPIYRVVETEFLADMESEMVWNSWEKNPQRFQGKFEVILAELLKNQTFYTAISTLLKNHEKEKTNQIAISTSNTSTILGNNNINIQGNGNSFSSNKKGD
jgi:hypothetical protein